MFASAVAVGRSNRGKRRGAGCLLLLLLLACGALRSRAEAAPPEHVRLQLKWRHQFQFAGYYAALEKGFYRDAGLEVDIQEAHEGVNPVDSVLKGQSDFGIYGTELVRYRAQGVPLVALAAIFQHSPAVIACRRDHGINQLSDIVGKRIWMEPDAADLLAFLKANGVDSSRFINPYDSSAGNFSVDTLIEGRVDGMYVYLTDELFALKQAKLDCKVFSPRDSGIDFYADILFTTEKTLARKPRMVRAFREATLKGWDYALAHKAEIIQLILDKYSTRHSREHLQFEAEQMQQLLEPNLVELGYMSRSRWEAIVSTYRQLGLLDGEVDLGRFLYTTTQPRIVVRYWREAVLATLLAGVALLLSWRYRQLAQHLKQENQQRQASEAALRASQHLVETAQAFGHIGSWVAEASGPLHWSAETCRLFGFAPGEFDGQPQTFLQMVYPEERERLLLAGRAASAQSGSYEVEYRIRRRDGETRWMHQRADTERDAQGQWLRTIGVVQDITERKRMEEQLRQAHKMESIGHLAGGVAHEFNNILAGVLLSLELAQLSKDPAEWGQLLGGAEASCKKAAHLVQQLLAFGRRLVVHQQPIDLAATVASQLPLLRQSLGERIRLEFVPPQGLPWVQADKSLMEQVLVNLCLNARDAMKDGGLLRLDLAEAQVGEEQAKAHVGARAGRYVRLSVTDTGCGMTETTLQRLYEPFFTTKDIGQGTGLGLATVRGIVQQHQGWIEVDSQLGKGSTFRVYLPAVAPASTQPARALGEPSGSGCGSILVVESEPSLRNLSRRVLVQKGYTVLEAASGAEALAVWAAHRAEIDLVYTDMVIPGERSGLQLALRMVADKPGLKVIIASGSTPAPADSGQAAKAAVAYVPKPCPPGTLASAVQKCLSAGRA